MMEASQNSEGGKGKNKRFWSKDEESALIEGLLKLKDDPQWRAEGGNFKQGYLGKLEEIINAKLCGCGLKATPHIESKTKIFRDKYNVVCKMLRTSGFSWDDTTKMIKCDRQSYLDFVKNHRLARGLWKVPFPYLEELEKIFGVDRAKGNVCEDFPEAADDTDNKAIDVDIDEEIHVDEEDESVQSTQPSPQVGKRVREDKISTDKGKKRMPEILDLTSSFNEVSTNLSGFMSGMNSHLETIASALNTSQQHEQALMVREQEVDEQKKSLFNEVMKIPGLTTFEAMDALKKLASDTVNLSLFYQFPDVEWKKEFVLNLIHPNLHPSSMRDGSS